MNDDIIDCGRCGLADTSRHVTAEECIEAFKGATILNRNAIRNERAAREQAERDRDRTLVAGAAQAHALLKALKAAVRHADQSPEKRTKDHACAECFPDGDIVIAGFLCWYHRARAAMKAPGCGDVRDTLLDAIADATTAGEMTRKRDAAEDGDVERAMIDAFFETVAASPPALPDPSEALAAAQARAADDRQALEGVAAKLREDRRFGGEVYAVLDPALNRAPGAHDAIDAALKAFAGSVEVEKWIERGLLRMANYVADARGEAPLHGSGEEADRIVAAMLASPPALPSASEALAAFAAFVLRAVNTCGACGVALLVYTSGLHCEDCPESDADGDPWPAPDPDEIVRLWLEREGR